MTEQAVMKTARPRGPVDEPLKQRDCEADGATENTGAQIMKPPPRHPATGIGE